MADYNLKQALSKIKAKPFNFALIEGKKSDMVLVTPKPAPGKLLDDTKKECGDGKRIAKGVCLKENGQIVFATRSAPMPAWKATLKKIFQEQKCSMFLPIELRQLGNNEPDEVVTEVVETNEEESSESDSESNNESGNDQESTNQAIPIPNQADSAQTTPPPTPQTSQTSSQQQQQSPPPQPTQAQTPPPPQQQQQQPQPQAKPPPPQPLAPETEALFKKRYQNCMFAELKVPAAQAQLKTQLKAALGIAKGLGEQHNFADANKKLDEVEKLLKAVPANQAPVSPKGSMVTYIQAKLDWRNVRIQVQSELQKVEQAVLDACKEQPNIGEIAGKVKNLYSVLNTLDERLIDKLDDALKAQEPEKKDFADQQSRTLIKEYLGFINSDPLMAVIDDNPFAPVNVKGRLVATLTDLDKKIV
ncbi:MAG: hypothetical protein JWQ71_1857 [Pedosphaera sp.]|nr:hypothetical protein [Pedosphaera sp.]